MKIKIENSNGNIYNLLRKAGYHPEKRGSSFSRSLAGGRFPRFHIYYNEKQNVLNLHLDQKPPTYKLSSDHGAEYTGPLVEKEAERIKTFLKI